MGPCRRDLLRALGGSAVTVGLAGCLGDGDETTPTTGNPPSDPGRSTTRDETTATPVTPPSTPGGSTVSDADEPGSLPSRASLDLYAVDSPLNTAIPTGASIDPQSDRYVDLLVRTGERGGFVIEHEQYSAPVYFATGDTPRHDVWLPCGSHWEMGVEYLRDVPIPAHAEPARDPVEGAPIPPGGCGEDAAPDDQMIVLDVASRCEYDFWQGRREEGRWVASWANGLSLDGTGIYPKGLSARGSGFSTLSGLIWPDELARGRIDHALVFSYPYPRAGGPVAPASESDGFSTKPGALPEGARVQLDPTLDLAAYDLTPAERTISRALQEYGMFLVDRGGSGAGGEADGDDNGGISTEAVDPRSVRGNPYAGLLPDVTFPPLDGIPIERLQVLELPPQNPDWEAETAVVNGGCGSLS